MRYAAASARYTGVDGVMYLGGGAMYRNLSLLHAAAGLFVGWVSTLGSAALESLGARPSVTHLVCPRFLHPAFPTPIPPFPSPAAGRAFLAIH